ncbi:MAG: cytochrome c3 family protein [Deltaproteobacteria bacterium]|nr:cytochrome c3 family protein [Deltaproteobacteria bacterium]
MKKIVLLVAMMAFIGLAAVAFGNPAAPAGDLKVLMDGAKKPAVTYSHAKHTVAVPDCKACHHTWSGEGAPKKCGECHTAKAEGKKLDMKGALHKNCKGCHSDMKKAGKKTGPTGCNDCHKK